MLNGLSPINQSISSDCMSSVYHLLHWIHRTQHVGNISDTDQFYPFIQKSPEHLHIQLTLIIKRHNFQHGLLTFTQHLPRNNIGMMFHFRHDDLITFPNKSLPESVSHEINTLGRSPGKYHLIRGLRMDKLPHGFPGLFIGIRTFITQIVHPPMYIGIVT